MTQYSLKKRMRDVVPDEAKERAKTDVKDAELYGDEADSFYQERLEYHVSQLCRSVKEAVRPTVIA